MLAKLPVVAVGVAEGLLEAMEVGFQAAMEAILLEEEAGVQKASEVGLSAGSESLEQAQRSEEPIREAVEAVQAVGPNLGEAVAGQSEAEQNQEASEETLAAEAEVL